VKLYGDQYWVLCTILYNIFYVQYYTIYFMYNIIQYILCTILYNIEFSVQYYTIYFMCNIIQYWVLCTILCNIFYVQLQFTRPFLPLKTIFTSDPFLLIHKNWVIHIYAFVWNALIHLHFHINHWEIQIYDAVLD
jgi:hypothetical protein